MIDVCYLGIKKREDKNMIGNISIIKISEDEAVYSRLLENNEFTKKWLELLVRKSEAICGGIVSDPSGYIYVVISPVGLTQEQQEDLCANVIDNVPADCWFPLILDGEAGYKPDFMNADKPKYYAIDKMSRLYDIKGLTGTLYSSGDRYILKTKMNLDDFFSNTIYREREQDIVVEDVSKMFA